MKYTEDINIYNNIIQRHKLYQFLGGINDSFDKDRRDILNKSPLPTVEEAYATIRREISRWDILARKPSLDSNSSRLGHGLVTKGPSLENDSSGSGFITKSRPPYKSRREEENKTHLHCTHCGGNKHTKEECFKLIGFPDWWDEHQARRRREGGRFEFKRVDDRKKWNGSHACLSSEHLPGGRYENGGQTLNKEGAGNIIGKSKEVRLFKWTKSHSNILSHACLKRLL